MAEKHPKGLYTLFFTEMWERFSFYLMIGLLFQYLVDTQKGGPGWSKTDATALVGSYTGLVYFMPFLGGLLADRVLGCRKTVMLGAVLMMFGHLALAIEAPWALYVGLGFLVLGNGAFKPNVSVIVGNLYPPNSPLKDSGYSIFYMGINIGAFTCNFIAAIVRNKFDEHYSEWGIRGWHAAFGTAAVGMLIALIVFASRYRFFGKFDNDPHAPGRPREDLRPLWYGCLGPAVIVGALGYWLGGGEIFGSKVVDALGLTKPVIPEIGAFNSAFLFACLPVIGFFLYIWRAQRNPTDRSHVAALLTVFAVSITFWVIFFLSTTALTDWALEKTDRRPNAVVRPIIDHFEEFAENAPPKYFVNASADTPRPARGGFEVVDDARYEQLKKDGKLTVEKGQPVYVTQQMLDDVYRGTTAETPTLPAGEHLRIINTELYQSINPGWIILLTPALVLLWNALRKRGSEPSTPGKMALSTFVTACSTMVMYLAVISTDDGAIKASSWWLVGTYALVTLGELTSSPIGLSLVSRVAPAHVRSFMMGGWFLVLSIGGKVSGMFGELYQTMAHTNFFLLLTACCVGTGLITLALLPWLKRQIATSD